MEKETHQLILEGGYVGHVMTRKLPVELDNSLYTLIHFLGGVTTFDVIRFGDTATLEEIEELQQEVENFPNTIQDIMPLAGNYKVLRNSPQYQKIINLIRRENFEEMLSESKKLDKLTWKKNPPKKHQESMDRGWGEFEKFPIKKFMKKNPPKNSSEEAMDELQLLDSLPVIEDFVETTDDIHDHFIEFLKSKKLDYPKKEIKKLLKQTSPIILKLKYHYNRPRPEQLAKEMGLKFHSEPLDSSRTPSYPSGHSAQGRFVGRYLSELYPKHQSELMKLGNEIGTGRLVAKVHYPSDDLFGKDIGDALFKTLDKKKLVKEDVEIDSDGYYTSDTNPYVLRYIKPKTKKALFNHWDSVGKPDWSALKLFGVEEDVDEGSSDFRNVSDVLYPLLVIEWLGGIENTPLAKEGWMEYRENYLSSLPVEFMFKIIPLRFDYLFDESASFGEQGYSCYDIKVIIDWGTPGPEREVRETLEEIFPKDKRNKLMSWRDYDDSTIEVLEELWEITEDIRGDIGVGQFCRVEIEVVSP